MTPRPSSLGAAFRALGVAAVMLALVSRVVTGAVVVDMPALDDVARLLAVSLPCVSDPGASPHDPDKAPHRDQKAALLAMASLLSDAAQTLLPGAPVTAYPREMVLAEAPTPPARAPPAPRFGPSLPRGPPVLI